MERRWLAAVSTLILLACVHALPGCMLDSPTYITTREVPQYGAGDAGAQAPATPPSSSGARGGSDSGAATCGSDFIKPDLATLKSCGDGKGHCFDKTKAPMADQLSACPDAAQVCVPDEMLTAAGGKLASCTSIVGPGGCVTAHLVPPLEQQGGGFLKQDVCAAGQLCAPCADPTNNNAPTPFCQPIGVHGSACGADAGPAAADAGPPPPAAKACCTTNGHSAGMCLPETAIPASQQSQTKQDVCDAAQKCVPAAFVKNTPVKCDGGLSGAGVCMDKCFNDMMSLAGDLGLLSNAGCGTTEVCVPCAFVSGQGVPGCK